MDPSSLPAELKSDLEAIATLVQTVAHRHDTDSIALLALLRVLEACHREVRDAAFQEALPKSRQQLYSFLKDIEAEGGWPYIPRMKVRSLLTKLDASTQDDLDRHIQEPRR